jgi:tetratricopeptide (TPR) repeat protein
MHKPQSVNASLFWNLDFAVGFSWVLTALGTVGLLGVLAYLVPLILVVLSLVYALRSQLFSPREKLYASKLGLASVFLMCGLLFYVPSQVLVLLAFAMAGVTVGFVLGKRDHAEEPRTQTLTMLSWGAALVLVVLLLWSGYGIGKRFVAEAYTNQGLVALQANDADHAAALAAKSQGVEKTADNLRLGTQAGLLKLQQMASAASNPSQEQLQAFANQAQLTIPQGQLAIAMDAQDYRPYVTLGQVYDLLATLKVGGAYDSAKASYVAAQQRNPTNPQIPLLLSRLEAIHGNLQGVQTYLSQSLTLKPDYTDAILFVVQLDVAQNDLPSAIKAATAAVQSAPGVSSIWFELGLLYYAGGDTKDAIIPLEQAVKLQNDYANAKYFLGLSYAAQGRPQDAIRQFQDLEKTNPDNQEVKLILNNLLSGKAPFTGAQPPVTNTPQDRTTAPISQ